MNELALRAELQPKLNKAKAVYVAMHDAELSLRGSRDRILALAYQLGELLCELKETVPGGWLLWLPANFRELGSTERMVIDNAERCMKLFKSNPDSGNSRNFSIDSIRKFMWGYIPIKERPKLEGNVEMNPGPHHLTFVNQFSKWDRQFRNGHVEEFELEMFRSETAPMLRRIAELGGREWAASLIN